MTTRTTTHLRRRHPLVRWLADQDPWLLISLLAIVLVVAGGTVRNLWLARSYEPAPAPIIIMATPQAIAVPTSAPEIQVAAAATQRLPRAVVAYSEPAPDAAIGAIEPGRAYTPTERLGDGWLLAEVAGSGQVWLRVVDLAGLAGVPDAAPPPIQEQQPAVLVVAPAVVEAAAQPTVAPPPTVAPAPTTAPWMVLHVATPEPKADDFIASFEAPAGPNPFVGCITSACREQFGHQANSTVEP